MTLREVPGALNRVQQSRLFKIVASIVLVVAAVAVLVTYVVVRNAPAGAPTGAAAAPSAPDLSAMGPAAQAMTRSFAELANRSADPNTVAVGCAVALVLGLVVVWLGVGLTYLGLGLVTTLVAYPMMKYGGNAALWRNQQGAVSMSVQDAGRFLAGIVAMTAAFSALIQALRLLLSGGGPVLSIARNVVDEAVRLKVSLVFIVLLMFGLASLPGLLDPTTPLRYRVQSFLQYGTAGSYWVIAVLTLFLSVATVAFEQRDRVIWQTMTKPVRPWQYVLGKWLGVSAVAAVLLSVSASGVFLFTGYLRFQPALDEARAFVPKLGDAPTEDRNILESQVLAARVGVRPVLELPEPEDLEREVANRLAKEMSSSDQVKDTAENRARIREEVLKERGTQFYTIEAGGTRRYLFRGLPVPSLSAGPSAARPAMTLRYKINAGGDDPRAVYRITFLGFGPGVFFEDDNQVFAPANAAEVGTGQISTLVREVPPGQMLRLSVSADAVRQDGTLLLEIANGDMLRNTAPNESIAFPPDGLEIFYSEGGYEANFARAMAVLWFKLAFLAMIGIACGTFLSFPVASLVAFGTFLIAESSLFLAEALEYYSSTTAQGQIIFYKVIIRAIAVPVSSTFKFYSQLRPTANLVDGRLVPWTSLLHAVVVIGGMTAVLFLIGSMIFRRRELATYSGS